MKNKSAILQMFYGQSGNVNRMKFIPESDPYVKAEGECYRKLQEMLEISPEAWELFLTYNQNKESLHLLSLDAHYLEGFKLGLLMGIEAGESKYKE